MENLLPSAGAVMDKSDGAPTVEFTLTAIPDSSGIFSIDARIPPVIFSEGDYTVKANYGGLIDNESFSIISGTPSTGENPSTGNPMFYSWKTGYH